MTDISLNKNIKNLFSGEFFQKKSVLSDSDIAALTKYNSEIERGVSKNIAFHKTMKDTSVAAQNMAKSAKGAAVNISEIPKQSKAAEVGLKALSIAGNMLVSMGVAWGISKIIEGIEWLATSSERAKEAAESLSSELKTQDENISGNIATLKGLEGEFNSLSKGVDDYGANISLSADEYARYQEIVQQIVGISPSLISGYDKEGNAIANKNGLIEQSIALLKEENRQRIENATSKDTIKTLGKGEVEKYKDVEVEAQNERRNNSFWVSGNYIQAENKNEKLLELIGINDKKPWWLNDNSFYGDKLRANYDILFQNFDKIIEYNDKLKSMGQPTLLTDEEITRLTKWADTYGKTEAKLEKASKSLNPTLQLVPQSLTVYDELSDKQKNFVSEYINTFRITADTTEADIEKMRQDILDFTQAIGDASPETKKAIEDLFSLDRSKISADEFEKQVNELINQIVNSLEFDNEDDKNEFVKNLKIRLGFEFTTDGKTTTKTMQDDIKAKLQDEFDDKVNDMSVDELKVAAKIVADIPEGTIISWDELQEKIKATADADGEATSSLSEFEKVSDNIGKISSAVKELESDGYVTIKTINELKTATGLSGDEWAEYENKLLNAKAGSAEFNQVMSDLTYKMIENQVKIGDLTNATDEEVAAIENKIAATLREKGVTNASAVAHSAVVRISEQAAAAKATEATAAYANALANGEDAKSAYENAQALLTECGSVEVASSAMEHLNIIQNIFNNTTLDASQKIAELQKYGFQASLTAAQLSALADTTMTYSDGKWWVNYYEDDKDNNGEKDYLYSEEYKGFEYKMPEITPPKFSGSSSSSKNADDAAKKELDALKTGLEMRQKLLEKYKDAIDLSDFGLDLAEETDFALRVDLLNSKMSQLTSYGQAMREEFDRVASIIPTTAEEADALASHLETLGSDMRSNIKALRETQVAMEQLKIDSIVSVSDTYLGDIDREIASIEKRIEMLNKDDSNNYEYTNEILQTEMFLPTTSSTIGARNNRRNEDKSIIEAQQQTNDTLSDTLETQIKLNQDLREEERQALLSDMETMRQDITLKLEESNKDYNTSWQNTINTTNIGATTVESRLNNMNLKIPSPDVSEVEKAFDYVRDLIENMGNANFTPSKPTIKTDGIK